jgi:hypothetical protein
MLNRKAKKCTLWKPVLCTWLHSSVIPGCQICIGTLCQNGGGGEIYQIFAKCMYLCMQNYRMVVKCTSIFHSNSTPNLHNLVVRHENAPSGNLGCNLCPRTVPCLNLVQYQSTSTDQVVAAWIELNFKGRFYFFLLGWVVQTDVAFYFMPGAQQQT